MAESQADAPDPVAQPHEVPFDGGCLGMLFVLIVLGGAVFAIAAFDSAFVASLADRESRRNIFAAISPLRIGSINIAALLLAGAMGWEGLRIVRRFLGRRAVWIEGEVIRFHPTIRRRALPLAELGSITHKADHASSMLCLQPEGGRRIKIPMVDHDAAEAFVAEAERARAALTFG